MSQDNDYVSKAAEIVAAYVANNPMPAAEIPALIEQVHDTLLKMRAVEPGLRQPAIEAAHSVGKDEVVCLECGRAMRFLRRHLMAAHGLTPDGYRTRWNLPASHQLTAPSYSSRRSEIAKQIGLGTGSNKKPAIRKRK